MKTLSSTSLLYNALPMLSFGNLSFESKVLVKYSFQMTVIVNLTANIPFYRITTFQNPV